MQTKTFPTGKKYGKHIAKERLKNILMRDRVETSGEMMHNVKNDLISVVQEYFILTGQGAELTITRTKRPGADPQKEQTVLVAMIPIEKVRRTDTTLLPES